jgi:hypothetical protein
VGGSSNILENEVKNMQPILAILDHHGYEVDRLALDNYDLSNPIETMALINEICAISHRQSHEIHLQLLSQGKVSLELPYAIQTLNAALKALVKFDYTARNSQVSPYSCDPLSLNLSWIKELIALISELTYSPPGSDRIEWSEITPHLETVQHGAIL